MNGKLWVFIVYWTRGRAGSVVIPVMAPTLCIPDSGLFLLNSFPSNFQSHLFVLKPIVGSRATLDHRVLMFYPRWRTSKSVEAYEYLRLSVSQRERYLLRVFLIRKKHAIISSVPLHINTRIVFLVHGFGAYQAPRELKCRIRKHNPRTSGSSDIGVELSFDCFFLDNVHRPGSGLSADYRQGTESYFKTTLDWTVFLDSKL